MARGNTYTCVACGKSYNYCPKCALVKPFYDAERYCSQEHSDIFGILSKHGCNLATAEETLDALKAYDTTGLNEGIQAHINSLQPKAETKREVETITKKNLFRTQE